MKFVAIWSKRENANRKEDTSRVGKVATSVLESQPAIDSETEAQILIQPSYNKGIVILDEQAKTAPLLVGATSKTKVPKPNQKRMTGMMRIQRSSGHKLTAQMHNLSIAIVVIGRNEGLRLRVCLESLLVQIVVYVDSGSSDDSVELANSFDAVVVELDMTRPFSAARARNEGFNRAMQKYPDTQFVQFVDGDCNIVDGWLEAAGKFMDENPTIAAVAGRLRERAPDLSVYNRLCDLEWDTPVGNVDACGGVAMVRACAFEQVGGFDESVVAGEEPELCVRLRLAGWKIHRLDAEMALHDAAMTRFGQWWKRAVRGGYGAMDVASRFEKSSGGMFSRQIRSARIWGIGWPITAILVTFAAMAIYGWQASIIAAICSLAILPMQIVRVAVKSLQRCGDTRTAFAFSVFMMFEKWANLQGQYRYFRDLRAGRHLSLIEYKQPAG